MLTYTEQLIEGIEYAFEEELEWWEGFNSKKDALKILRYAESETVEEYQIAILLDLCNCDFFEEYSSEQAYSLLLKDLRKQSKLGTSND